jgi:peptidoglycan/xylan/chitin deacetylase (PgdA/CDA1 family)
LFIVLLQLLPVSQSQTANSWDGTLRRIRIPILMYHYVSELPADADEIRTNLTLSPFLFQQHVNYLKDNGYQTISLYEAYNALMYGTPLPSKPIILTFDDGYIDHYTQVFPVLKEAGYVGTFFIITNFADENRYGYLTWSQINEMAQNGMSMESHTKTHSDLRQRSYDFLVYEFLGSIESLQNHLNMPADMFAYPVGRYDDNTLAVIATTPLKLAVTTQMGAYLTSDNRYELPRLRVTNETAIEGLKWLLNYNR